MFSGWVVVVPPSGMDNHKVAGVCETLATAGARLLYLPLYSSDFTPIETLWSQIKSHLRCLAPRTADEILHAGVAT